MSKTNKPLDLSNALNRRTFLVSIATVAGGTALVACSTNNSTNASNNNNNQNTSSSKKYSLAVVGGMAGVPFYEMIKKGAEEEAKAQGMDLTYQAPKQWDPVEQTKIVEALIARKVNAIIISPCDNQALVAPLQKAHDAGITVITVDTVLGDGDYANGSVKFPITYIGSDNTKGGKIAGEVMIKAIGGKGKVYIQSNKPGTSSTDQREKGFKEAIAATNGAVTIVSTSYDEGSMDKATQQTSAVLQAHPDIAGIFGTTAFSSEGAAAAVKNANKSNAIKIIHFDSSQQGVTDLRNGIIDFIIGQKPREMGKIGVQYAIKALNGDSSLQKNVQTDFVVIDKTNVDTPESQNAIY